MLFITSVTHRLKLSFKVNAAPEAVHISELFSVDEPNASSTRLNPAHNWLGAGMLRDILRKFFRSPRAATAARAAFYSNQGFRDNRARIACRNSADFARPHIGPSARSATNRA